MDTERKVFAIYSEELYVEDAVNELCGDGFTKEAVSVLFPENKETREFAERKGTHPPKGTKEGRYADIPLDGKLGFLNWAEGPLQGALHDALIEMGVPSEWCDRRVVHGKFLISVRCKTRDEFFRAVGILKFSGAFDISWTRPPAKRRARAQKA
jgi:hypothetical protein